MKVYLQLINLHLCVLVPLLIYYIYPDDGYILGIIWIVGMFIVLFLDDKIKNGKA